MDDLVRLLPAIVSAGTVAGVLWKGSALATRFEVGLAKLDGIEKKLELQTEANAKHDIRLTKLETELEHLKVELGRERSERQQGDRTPTGRYPAQS